MRAVVLLLVFAATLRCFSQGTVNFANGGVGVDAPLTNTLVTPFVRASGPGFQAQLYAGPAGITDMTLLTTNGVSGTPAVFFSGAAAGYFLGNTRGIEGLLPQTTATLQVRAWSTLGGATSWETALWRRESNLIQVLLGGGTIPPPNMVGLTFEVPEPPSHMLAALGLLAAVLLGVHRRIR